MASSPARAFPDTHQHLPAAPPELSSPAGRRRSILASSLPCAGASITGPASPLAHPRRPSLFDAGSGEVAEGVLDQPLHLSVPMTILCMHNGGSRHARSSSRDASPLLTLLEGSGTWLYPGDGDQPAQHPPAPPAPAAPHAHALPTTAADAAAAGAPQPANHPPFDACTAEGAGAAGAALTGGGDGDGGGSAAVAMPLHLCSHRPPTPLFKEEDLLSSMRHMTSPSKRRSRFACAADPSLSAAAAAAVAADDAGLLESPPSTVSGYCAGEPRRASAVGMVAREAAASWGGSPGAGSASRRAAQQLGSVPEEPLHSHTRGDSFPSPSSDFGGGSAGSATGLGRAGSSALGGSGGACAGRRQRPSAGSGAEPCRSPRAAPPAAAAVVVGGGAPRDALSDFMHNLGPARA